MPCSSTRTGDEDGPSTVVERATVPPPALVATVVAPRRRDYGEAMRAKGDLEGVARMVQDEWREYFDEGSRADGTLPNGL